MYIATDRGKGTKFNFFDLDFNHLPFQNGYPNSSKRIKKPKNFDKMIELASKLSQNIPHVRVDFYEINDEVYFGEMTFFHMGGLAEFDPDEYDELFGSWIELPWK